MDSNGQLALSISLIFLKANYLPGTDAIILTPKIILVHFLTTCFCLVPCSLFFFININHFKKFVLVWLVSLNYIILPVLVCAYVLLCVQVILFYFFFVKGQPVKKWIKHKIKNEWTELVNIGLGSTSLLYYLDHDTQTLVECLLDRIGNCKIG